MKPRRHERGCYVNGGNRRPGIHGFTCRGCSLTADDHIELLLVALDRLDNSKW